MGKSAQGSVRRRSAENSGQAVVAGMFRRADRSKEAPLLSERLLAVLVLEVDALEESIAPDRSPSSGLAKAVEPAAEERLSTGGSGASRVRADAAGSSAGGKARIETIGQVTRTLEKLLELKRLERLAQQGEGAEDGEIERLAAEMMKRLRSLDRRRGGGAGLFTADGGLADAAPDATDMIKEPPVEREGGA